MKNEKEIFSTIIGYDDIKKTLKTIVDVLNNEEKYKKLGCSIAHGLLLYGSPGTGKTSIANEILDNALNRKKYIIRKTKSDGDFMDYMNEIFEEAVKNQPSIILLDDLDKFSENDNRSNQEEYVTVQSLIDDIKDEDVFVIATANDYSCLPDSLVRAGRFDIKIFEFYLRNKKISKDVNIKDISCILTDSSCAELEKVCNQAGIYAGYKNKTVIEMDDLVRASLELKYKANIEDLNKDDKYSLETAYHEAGHALIGEYLEPGLISFITIVKSNSKTKGMTIYHDNEDYFRDIVFMQNRVKMLLAGKATTEVVFNKCDVGSEADINRAYLIVQRIVDGYCYYDFESSVNRAYKSNDVSERVKGNKETSVNKLVKDYYNEVKKILIEKRIILDELASKLNNKKYYFRMK